MIPITSIDILRKLAALAPVDERAAGPAGSPAPAAGATSPRSQGSNTLGPLDVGRYLSDHGIEHRVKRKGDADFYVLKVCLFDPGHRNGEAAIVSGSKGFFYQCFHLSCSDRTWADARALISGDKSLAPWMEGYDPNWKKKKKNEEKALVPAGGKAPFAPPGPNGEIERRYATVDNIINPVCSAVVTHADGSTAPAPREVNHIHEFYEKRGSRMEFVPRYAANYLFHYLSPVAFSAGEFWKYADGVWGVFPREQMAAILTHTMKERIQAKMVEGVLGVLQGLVYVPEDEWEPDPFMINVKNGMLDIKTMVLRPHSPDYRSRVQLPVNYDPQAPVATWYEFLKDIFPEDHVKDDKDQYVNYLNKHVLAQQFAGYTLLRDCRYHKSMFLYGTGSNGKSTFLNVIGAVLGEKNTCSLSLTTLGERFKSIYLYNKMANLASETNPKAIMESDIFNQVVSGDEITAEEKYGKAFKFRPFCKFIVSMNEPPLVQDRSYAFERRVLVLNFNRRFTPDEVKSRMTETLLTEVDGVFTWMVEGLKLLLKHDGFVIGANIQDEIDQMLSRVNPFIVFVEDCLVLEPESTVRTQEIWEVYRDWCMDGGNRALGRNKFLDQVLSQFPKVKKTREDGNTRIFSGISLNQEAVDALRIRLAARPGKTRDRD
jgi:P4 family phage/plasmid primase-like protien